MTVEEVLDLFVTIVDDDEISEPQGLILMNNAQMQIEDMRDWVILRSKDKTITHLSTDTWQTSHSLPTNFKKPRLNKVFVQFSNGHVQPINEISFDELEAEKDTFGKFAIDYANKLIYFTGSYDDDVTLIMNYVKRATQITATTDTIIWPGTYGSVLAFQMAKVYTGAIDGDDVNFKMSPSQTAEYMGLLNGLKQWDGALQISEMGGQVGINPQVK